MTLPRLELRGITKRYPAVVANQDIALSVMPGEIHAVLGENGAGKSTLMKIIAGEVAADSGTILWDGAAVTIASPAAARRLGIGIIHQHFSLFESLTVAENVAIGGGGTFDLAALSRRLGALSERYDMPVDTRRLVRDLSVGERQRVEILRCLLETPRLLILDEPTSVLAPQAIEGLFEVVRRLAGEGCSILYISHKLKEIGGLCDSATILRGGRVVARVDPGRESAKDLARLMVGGDIPEIHRAPSPAQTAPLLELDGLSAPPDHPFGTAIEDVTLRLHAGEIVGIAGVSGNGQAELIELLSGERRAGAADMIRLDGAPIGTLDAARRRRHGLRLVPEERLGRGTVPAMGLLENVLLTDPRGTAVWHGLIDHREAAARTAGIIERFAVKCGGPRVPAQSLSGGNLQRFIVGRELALQPRVLVVAQPTWGVDVAAARFIRQALIELSRSGVAILVISEELDELFQIADRLTVLYRGRLSPARPAAMTSAAEIGMLMSGVGG